MAVIKCPSCGKYISSQLAQCPECGADIVQQTATDQTTQDGVPAEPSSETANPAQEAVPASPVQPAPQPRRLSKRRVCCIVAAVVVLIGICFLAYKDHVRSVGLEERAYERLEGCANLDWYEDYLVRFPDGEHVEQVKKMYEKAKREQMEFFLQAAGGSKEQLLAFIRMHPSSPYCKVCESRIDSLDWQTATSSNSLAAYSQYLLEHPDGIFAQMANDKKLTLQKQEISPDERSMLNGAVVNFLAAMTSGDIARVDELVESPLSFCGQSDANGESVVRFYTSNFHRDDILGVHFSTRGGLNIRKQSVAGSDTEFGYTISAQLDATLNRTSTDSLTTETWNLSAQMSPDRRFTSISLTKR